MEDYFNGTRVITHDDGSQTTIYYEHEEPVVPLTLKGKLFLTAVLVGAPAVAIGIPVLLEKWVDGTDDRAVHRKRQKANKEIFDQIPA